MVIRYSTCDAQQNFVKVNGSLVGGATTIFPASCAWTDITLTVNLVSGSNTISIEKDWGWIMVDYITISTSKKSAKVVTEILETDLIASLTVYPNPVHGMLNISLLGFSGKTEISLISIEGRILKKEVMYNQKNMNMDLSEILPGVYILRVNADSHVVEKRLIIK